MKPSPLFLTAFLALPAAFAGEFKVEKKPFKSTVSLDGVFLPDKVHALKIDPKVWADFTIKELVGQGSPVKKGEPVVVLDTKAIDRQLADDTDATSLRKMTLGVGELDLANLEKTTPWQLERLPNTGRRHHPYRLHEIINMSVIGGVMTSRPSSNPATESRKFEALRIVPQGETCRFQRSFNCWPKRTSLNLRSTGCRIDFNHLPDPSHVDRY